MPLLSFPLLPIFVIGLSWQLIIYQFPILLYFFALLIPYTLYAHHENLAYITTYINVNRYRYYFSLSSSTLLFEASLHHRTNES